MLNHIYIILKTAPGKLNVSPAKFNLYLSVVAGAAAEDYYESDYEDPAKVVVVKSSAKAVTHISTSMYMMGAASHPPSGEVFPLPLSSYARGYFVLHQMKTVRL